jgi:hypothetical protein
MEASKSNRLETVKVGDVTVRIQQCTHPPFLLQLLRERRKVGSLLSMIKGDL